MRIFVVREVILPVYVTCGDTCECLVIFRAGYGMGGFLLNSSSSSENTINSSSDASIK